jgi:hypothetical protein
MYMRRRKPFLEKKEYLRYYGEGMRVPDVNNFILPCDYEEDEEDGWSKD